MKLTMLAFLLFIVTLQEAQMIDSEDSDQGNDYDLHLSGSNCVNDDSTVDDAGDTCSDYYDENPDDCGIHDTEDFTAAEQCCACIDFYDGRRRGKGKKKPGKKREKPGKKKQTRKRKQRKRKQETRKKTRKKNKEKNQEKTQDKEEETK